MKDYGTSKTFFLPYLSSKVRAFVFYGPKPRAIGVAGGYLNT
jgi:hypothetical protein